jgi:hypothetical protein
LAEGPFTRRRKLARILWAGHTRIFPALIVWKFSDDQSPPAEPLRDMSH